MGFLIHKIWQILKRFSRALRWAQTFYLWGVSISTNLCTLTYLINSLLWLDCYVSFDDTHECFTLVTNVLGIGNKRKQLIALTCFFMIYFINFVLLCYNFIYLWGVLCGWRITNVGESQKVTIEELWSNSSFEEVLIWSELKSWHREYFLRRFWRSVSLVAS